MTEIKPEDLKPFAFNYQSSRNLNDVLIGDDTALPFINACSTGDITTLRSLLEQSPEVAMNSPHRIYQEDRPAKDGNDVRGVLAMKKSNLDQAVLRAAENGHAIVVSTLIDFALQNSIKPSSIIDRETIKKTIENDHADVFEALAKAEPTVAIFDIIQRQRPLDWAISHRKLEVAKVILQHGGGREIPSPRPTSSYPNSRLCRAVRSGEVAFTELLLQYGYAVKGSGVLHMAAERGDLDTIRLLVDKHEADVNERLPAETLPRVDNALYASWTPMHFAASYGREEAMKLLESYGAKTDVADANGRSPLDLLQERKEASDK
jgi:ankyrin repeat protein